MSGRTLGTYSLTQEKQEWLWYFLAAITCVVARTYLIQSRGLFDYDSVRNWEILQEIKNGNLEHVFHHASPGFYLLYAPFTFIFHNPNDFIYLNIFFGVGSVFLLIRFFRLHLALPVPEAFLTGLLFGLSVFAVHHSRDLSIEAVSLFLFMVLLERYYARIKMRNAKALYQAAAVLAVGITVNYKLLLVLLVAIVLEIFQRDGLLTKKILFRICLLLLAPFVVFALVAIGLNQPFYRFPAAIISINNFTRPNPALRTGRLNLDLSYYPRYILGYEWPLLVPALVLFPFLFWRQLKENRGRGLNFYQFIFLVVYLFLAGMQLLLKAPRGLTFIYGLVYFISYLVLKRLIPSRTVILLWMILGLGYQLWKLQKEVYHYSFSSYSAVAAFLKQQNIKKVATTVGRGLVPLARQQGIEVKVLLSETDIQTLKAQGFDYVILDNYYKASNIRQFEQLRQWPEIKSWPEPNLLNPLLFLDHSEFTGLSYIQTLALHRASIQDTVQLRLLRIP